MSAYSDAVLATSGLVAYWRLGDTASPAVDIKNANNGTQVNGPTFGSASLLTDGNADTSVTFAKASTQYITVPDNNTLDVGDVYSVEGWCNIASFPGAGDGNGGFSSFMSKGAGTFSVGFNVNKHVRWDDPNTAIMALGTATLVINTTYHIVVTKNGATLHIYVNGVDGITSINNRTCGNNARVLGIGGHINTTDTPEAGQYWDGVLDELALYNVDLSAATVLDHYTKGTTVPAAGAAGPWRTLLGVGQ